MRLLITGGAGFIGSHIADEALARDWEVAIIDNLSTGRRANIPTGVILFELDIRNRESVQQAFRDFQPQVVSHQAAQASVAISVKQPVLDAEINVIGSLNLLDAAVEQKVERFVFASTGGAIYGEVPEGTAASETTPPHPLSPYAASKYAVENYLRCYEREHGLQTTVLRYANVYGPRQDPHGEAGVVAIFLNRLIAGEPLRINARVTAGDDGCIRDYVHVRNCAQANIAATAGELPVRLMNVGTGQGISTRMLADTLQSLAGTNSQLEFGPLRAGDTERSVLSPALFQQHIGTPVSLEQGLQDTVDWFRASKR
ncbi:MAG: NAD-dependent epimerase/dehydratase family protein [Planctomycetaceae bacterium]|nr:NAD-dependent epimerase/dehydratase family protein [Planctomycetaceae bacterium]